jgi:hypothetical protein
MVVIYSDSYQWYDYRNYQNVKYYVGYDKGERMKMSRKVLENWSCKVPLMVNIKHGFYQFTVWEIYNSQ